MADIFVSYYLLRNSELPDVCVESVFALSCYAQSPPQSPSCAIDNAANRFFVHRLAFSFSNSVSWTSRTLTRIWFFAHLFHPLHARSRLQELTPCPCGLDGVPVFRGTPSEHRHTILSESMDGVPLNTGTPSCTSQLTVSL